MEVEHSRLLKFFKEARKKKPEMAESPEVPAIKIQNDYQNPPNVEAEVPATHKIREYDEKNNRYDTKITGSEDPNTSSVITVTGADFNLSPVITVTKNESTFTKGDLKLQKVTVTEDIAEEESRNGGHRISRESVTLTGREADNITAEIRETRNIDTDRMEGEEKSQDDKKSKIPMLRLRQAVEKVKREREKRKERGEKPRRSSIPTLKDPKKAIKRDASLNIQPAVDDEFDKLYEEIVDNKQKDIEEKLPSVTMEDPEKIETKFEEIIHAYDEDEHEKHSVARVSKIPALKRKDDGSSRITAMIDRAKEKTMRTETQLKDGGFKVTATSIKTKRFSRGNSKDLSGEEQHIEITETIDIKESGDNEVFLRETVKTAPAKPERTFRNISKRIVAGQNAGTVETKEIMEDGTSQTIVTENLDKKDGTQNKTKRFTRTVSKERKERNLNRELSRNLENIRREFRNRIEDARLDPEFSDDENNIIETTVTDNAQEIPVKTEKIVRGISREISKDGQIQTTVTETVQGVPLKTDTIDRGITREMSKDGKIQTTVTEVDRGIPLKTETIVRGLSREMSKDGEIQTTVTEIVQEIPVKTETIVRGITREMSKDGKNININETVTVEELDDGGTRTITTKTTESLIIGTPVVTEKVIRNISRQSTEGQNSIKGVTTIEETSDGGVKKITKETHLKEHSSGIPVKTERFTRGISREMGNINLRRSREFLAATENSITGENKELLRQESLKTEQIEKEGIKVGIPVFTKITRSFSKGKIQNVQMSRTIEWKPADEVKTKNYSRSVSEKVTKKELKDVGKWKYEAPIAINEVTSLNEKPIEQSDITPKDPVFETKIKGTVKDIASKISSKKVTEYKSEEQVTNIEKTTFTLSSNVDLNVDRDLKASREIGTQMSLDSKASDRNYKFIKEVGTQMSVEGKYLDSPFDRDFKLAKERSFESKSDGLTVGGDVKTTKDFGTQMSVVGKIVDKDFKVSKEIGTEMSLEGTKHIENSTTINQNFITMGTINEKSVTEYSNLPTQDKDSDTEGVTILKGNVSRMKDKIARNPVVVSKKETDEELPKKKSVSSKIAIFERLEPNEPYPVAQLPKHKTKSKYVPPDLSRLNSADRPKIVDEILKETSQSEHVEITQSDHLENTQFEPLEVINKVEIGLNYDEVTYRTEPMTGKQYWSTEKRYGKTVSDFKQMNNETNEVTNLNQQKEGKGLETVKILPETVKILPETVDFKTQESQIEQYQTVDDKAPIRREPSIIEMPTIFPAKINYEADIGKTKPGKINLNVWSSHVEMNKSSIDKIELLREESLNEIAQTLPVKVDIKTYESHVLVSKDLPENIGITEDNNQIHAVTILPAKIDFNSEEIAHTLVRLDSRIDDAYAEVDDSLPDGYLQDLKTFGKQIEIASTLPSELISNHSETTSTIIGNSAENQIMHAKTSTNIKDNLKPEANQKEVNTKPKPGKINFSLWKNQVEVNKTLVGKSDLRKTKDAEIAKALSGRVDFKPKRKQTKVTEAVQSNNILNIEGNKAETPTGRIDLSPSRGLINAGNISPGKIELDDTENYINTPKPSLGFVDINGNETQVNAVRTLPETITFSTASSQRGETTILPGRIDFSSSEMEEPKILQGKIEFETEFVPNESRAEISESSEDNIYFSSIQHQTESYSTMSGQNSVERVGKLDLKAWEHQIEVNKTLVDKTEVEKGEHLEEIANTLQGQGNLVTYETRVGKARTFQAPIDLNKDENKVEITELDVDTEVAKILPEPIELDPFKHTPRFNPLPMLIRLNSQENMELNYNVSKVEIPIESNPRKTLSDPELVDEDPVEVKLKKDAIIGNIKRKLYFITNNNNEGSHIKTPVNTPVPAESEYEYNSEKRVEELFNLNEVGKLTSNETETRTYINSATANSYEITAETIEESNAYNEADDKNYSIAEYEIDFDTFEVQTNIKTDRSGLDDVIKDFKQYGSEKNLTYINKNVTHEYGFNFDVPKVGNQLTRSAYDADDFKKSTEELKRAKSLAELDLGDVVHGQVKRIVGRIKSVDFSRRESIKTEINIKELPKKMTVLERIALFEGKTARARYESTTIKTSATKSTTIPEISEEAYLKKIEELTTGKTKFGRLEDMLYLPLADGSEIPILALGTALVDPRLLSHVIGAAIDMGYRAIDTAYIYGNEKEIGQAIKAKIDDGTVKREDLYIISKLWSTYHRTDLVEVACKASLENMGLDYFDLYLIHNPMSFKEGADPIPKIATVLQYSQSDYLDAWFGMEGLVSKGLVKSIGVSNFNSQQIQKILDKGKIKPVVNQVECHPYLSQQRLHAFCADRKITLSCFGVLGSKGTPAAYKNSTAPVIDDALVKVMASGLGVTPAQLLIRMGDTHKNYPFLATY